MADVEYHDYSVEVKEALSQIAWQTMEEVAGELESQTKRNTVVDTGQTKNSWSHRVTGSMMAAEYRADVGSNYENAIWEEFGTGEYALNGDGRKGGWFYKDEWGIGHFTHGKHPRRPLYTAYTSLKTKLIRHMQNAFKKGLS